MGIRLKEISLIKTYYENSKLDKLILSDLPNEKIQSKITKMYFENMHKSSGKIFYKYETYFYDNYGMFLKGDEGTGWHWERSDVLMCEKLKNEKRH